MKQTVGINHFPNKNFDSTVIFEIWVTSEIKLEIGIILYKNHCYPMIRM